MYLRRLPEQITHRGASSYYSTIIVDLSRNLIALSLTDPRSVIDYSMQTWDLLLRQGRRSMLLSRLCHILLQQQLLERLPEQVRQHLLSEYVFFEKLDSTIRWEIRCITRALEPLGCPTILLKGAGYLIAGNTAAGGRVFSDVDILVPKGRINEVESALRGHGWVGTHQNDYDQRYYRQWMHELPPMIHLKRHSNLDVHHNILPEVGRVCPDAEKLFEQAEQIPEGPLLVLAPVDRVIHSAVHLFHDGELDHGLRDLSDIDLLLREYADSQGFWESLPKRADELRLSRSLYYALRYTKLFFNTPIPDVVISELNKAAPGYFGVRWMDSLFQRALMPDHSSCDDRFTGLARWLLFIRSHWLCMPPLMLARHLLKKAGMRWQDRRSLKKR